jgi:hypothetical protein
VQINPSESRRDGAYSITAEGAEAFRPLNSTPALIRPLGPETDHCSLSTVH